MSEHCTCPSCWREALRQLIALVADVIPARGIPDPSPMRERKRAYDIYLREAQRKRAA